ncbi:CHAT domain-containing protein [Sediminicurvatus halobius]|uniref:CHAT domain-containing protein n=1 Tax=Sediminicurvatus halobius TaxID=2182432 RepID=A0A2U2N9F2_9GAMM|nr:CHAT domain-containing protein [Spiribacter halobius]PWG65811.1 hypothetical protein DEM34_00670 [Spiribacter halobius]UEX77853.1 CHAT domain-containing protein [Spiribacter halobius]
MTFSPTRRRLGALGLLLAGLLGQCAAAADFGDDAVAHWREPFWRGEPATVIARLEAELDRESPHPLAAQAWTAMHRRTDTLASALRRLPPARVQALGAYPEMRRLEDAGRADLVIERYADVERRDPSSLWTADLVARSAEDLGQLTLAQSIRIAAIARWPQQFQLVWPLLGDRYRGEAARGALQEALANGPIPAGSPAAEALSAWLANPRPSASDRVALARAWLRREPDDVRARMYLANRLYELGHMAESRQEAMKALQAYPFYTNWDRLLAADTRLGEPLRGELLLDRLMRGYHRLAPERERDVNHYLAAARRFEGDLGEARAILDHELAEAPDTPRVHAESARLEREAGRLAEAVAHARQAVALSDRDPGHWTLLIDLLRRDGRHREAVNAFEQALEGVPGLPPRAYWAAAGALRALERNERMLAVTAAAVDRFPESAWMWRERALALHTVGQTGRALDTLRRAITLAPSSTWAIRQAARWSAERPREPGEPDLLTALATRYPWQAELWEQLAERAGEQGARLAVWRRAATANPHHAWPVGRLAQALAAAGNWEEALATVRTYRDGVVSSGGESRQVRLLLPRLLDANPARQMPAEAVVQEALADLRRYRELGGSTVTYHELAVPLYQALGDAPAAAESALAAARVDPGPGRLHELIAEHGAELGARAWRFGRRTLERRPMDPEVIVELVHKHVLWGGSPVVALTLIEQARGRGVADHERLAGLEGRAYGQLGDAVREYEANYVRSNAIGPSQRYVDWYEDARAAAMGDERMRVRLVSDAEQPSVDLIDPDGSVTRRSDHPVTGRTTLLRRNGAWLRADFEPERLQLARVEDSAGRWLALDYTEGRVTRLRSDRDPTVTIGYAAGGRPARVEVAGVGRLRIEYADDGGIAALEASDQEGDAAGTELTLRITQAFQTLQGRIAALKRALEASEPRALDDSDPEHERLFAALQRAPRGSEAESRAALALAGHEAAHRGLDPGYGAAAEQRLRRLVQTGIGDAHAMPDPLVHEAINAWQALLRDLRPYGVTDDEDALWREAQRWRALRGEDTPAAGDSGRLPARLERPWLDTHALGNPAHWRRFGRASVLPPAMREADARAMLVRRNGDVVIGTRAGLTVQRRGYWEWFGFNPAEARMSSMLERSDLDARSSVLALAEDRAGTLWIGTEDGLLAVEGDYDSGARVWRTRSDGLPSGRVTALAALDGALWIGTSAGLRRWDGTAMSTPPATVADADIRFLDAPPPGETTADTLLVGTAEGLAARHGGHWRTLLERPVDAALLDLEAELIHVLEGDRLRALDFGGTGRLTALPGAEAVRFQRRIHGLARLEVAPLGTLPVVLTDTGLAFVHRLQVNFMSLPLAHERDGRTVGPRLAASGDGASWLLTTEGVYGFEPERSRIATRGRVHDLLTLDAPGLTLVAEGDRLGYVDHQQPGAGVQTFDTVRSTRLAATADGGVITNDGLAVLHYPPGENRPRQLFRAEQTVPEDWMRGPLRDLMVSNDGAIWAAAGPTVFRYHDGELERFSWFQDAERFPARSHMISRLIESVDGEILAVASNERHLSHRGVALSGGLLRLRGDRFERAGWGDYGADWFITGYTAIDPDTAIVGSHRGFGREQAGDYAAFADLGDPGYSALAAAHPQVWLGGDGARVSEDSWVFPSAAGVLLWHEQRWQYPARLNRLLPDDVAVGQYGGRTVHAVESDASGRIYAGTDRGLLVYDAGGEAASLLVDNGFADIAFTGENLRTLRREREILLPETPRAGMDGRLLAGIQAAEGEISELEAQLGDTQRPATAASRAADTEGGAQSLRARLEERRRARDRLLARLEREDRGLHQMLTLDPRALSALHRQLQPGHTVVQYIPDRRRLHIQVVTREGTRLTQVEVGREAIRERVTRVTSAMAARVGRLGALPSEARGLSAPDLAAVDDALVDADLEWLYDHLLRPVRFALEDADRVLIVPSRSLYYLPFAALRERSGEAVRFVAERHAIGMLPSLFHLSLVLQHSPSLLTEAFVVGDPDGTLPGARSEAQRVHALLGGSGTLLTGSEATYQQLSTRAPEGRYVHLATHGVLDHQDPANSHLVLAGGRRLDVLDIQALELAETDLVVLSACETGIGTDGLEVATLARAFAHAGVPSVVASLWRVDDRATTALMTRFYERLRQGGDIYAALAGAQRDMLADGEFADPAAWSGFMVLGKP